jgi:hypothetical protein
MAKKSKKASKGEVLVIASKLKDAIKKRGCNTSSDVVAELSAKLHAMVDEACARCKDNGRKTVRGYDF